MTRVIARVAMVLGVLILAGCSPTVTVHGYVPSEAEIASIEPGIDTIASIEERLGRPASTALVSADEWYYVQTTMKQLAYNPPEITDRVVLAVAFDRDGVVRDVSRYGLNDGQEVPLSARITESGGQRRNVLLAVFGGLLNFDASDFLNR
ncbi:outer membrane protein assembly factor BamE [Rhodobacteraceae bacterium 2CG4]|uniref:Outer membrane protein assembly factor BamE n=1 Tax=Halovulum marinum TaxID=2662447 RepID=A0A6L5YZY5_9RHOB|nr:outer membrane protein assembly factor BamE [Halovulum marinum]MSU89798.1 outer membrane protein assembly factor BamE [Halovulum marinum]